MNQHQVKDYSEPLIEMKKLTRRVEDDLLDQDYAAAKRHLIQQGMVLLELMSRVDSKATDELANATAHAHRADR
jgi:hypothetical protein